MLTPILFLALVFLSSIAGWKALPELLRTDETANIVLGGKYVTFSCYCLFLTGGIYWCRRVDHRVPDPGRLHCRFHPEGTDHS